MLSTTAIVLYVILVSALVVFGTLWNHKRNSRYWKLNKDRHLVALQSFSIRSDTHGYDVIKGQIGAKIPLGTHLPRQTQRFWVDISSHISGNCTFGADIIVGRDCNINDTTLYNGCELKDGAKVYTSTLGVNTTIGVRSVVYESKIGDHGWVLYDSEIHRTSMGNNCNVLGHSKVINCVLFPRSTVGFYGDFHDTTLLENVKVADYVSAKGLTIPHSITDSLEVNMESQRYVLSGEFIVLTSDSQTSMIYKLNDDYHVTNFGVSYKLCEFDEHITSTRTSEGLATLIQNWKQKLLQGEQ